MKPSTTPKEFVDQEFPDELQPGMSLLHGQYTIEEYLNSGGFGITYLAEDSLRRRVVIKECFPGAFCRRSKTIVGVRSRAHAKEFRMIVDLFVQEARNLARLNHPNIVGVHQVFEDNGTAYMALDYVDGRDLLEIAEDPTARLDPKDLEAIVVKLLDAIEFIHHEGVLHRDISPDNILISREKEPVLIDFGAARETASRATRHLGAMRTVKDGYSPQEFYISDGASFPSSDLYSLGASLYHVITGNTPPNAQERLTAVASDDPDPYVPIADRTGGYKREFLEAIDRALAIFPKNRIQSAADWRAMITHSRVSSLTRGSVSRPVLAVDNGFVVSQIKDLVREEKLASQHFNNMGAEGAQSLATEAELEAAGLAQPKRPRRPNQTDRPDTPRPPRGSVTSTPSFVDVPQEKVVTQVMRDTSGSKGKLGLVAGLLALLAAAGVGGYVMMGSDETPDVASISTPAATAEPAVVAPVETAEIETPVAPTPEPEVAAVEATVTPPAAELKPRVPAAVIVPAVPAEPEVPAVVAEPATTGPVPSEPAAVEGEDVAVVASRPDVTKRPPSRPAAISQPEVPAIAPTVSERVATLPNVSTEDLGVDVGADVDADPARTASIVIEPQVESGAPSVDRSSPAPLPPEPAQPSNVIEASPLLSGATAAFPFMLEPNGSLRILSVDASAPEWLESGSKILSVNGLPVISFSEVQQVVKLQPGFGLGASVKATLGIETPDGQTLVRSLDVPTVQETILLTGERFRTAQVDGAWVTTVIESPTDADEALRTGDIVVAFMPSSELIDTPLALQTILAREIAAGAPKFNFAVKRDGEMWLVSTTNVEAGN